MAGQQVEPGESARMQQPRRSVTPQQGTPVRCFSIGRPPLRKQGGKTYLFIRVHGIIQTPIRVGCARFHSLCVPNRWAKEKKMQQKQQHSFLRSVARPSNATLQTLAGRAVPASSKELCSPPSPTTSYLPAAADYLRSWQPEPAARSKSPACSIAIWALRPPTSPAITSRAAAFHGKSRWAAARDIKRGDGCSREKMPIIEGIIAPWRPPLLVSLCEPVE